jgi:superfamily I DNA and RNA helicase
MEIITEKIKVKKFSIPTDDDGSKSYSLDDIPEPKYTKPGSKARDKQIKKLVTSQSGAKAIEKELKRRETNEQVGHTHQTSHQQISARQLDRSKRTRHSNIVKSTMKGASSYDQQQKQNITNIEDRRS